jgi:hypothetical protein
MNRTDLANEKFVYNFYSIHFSEGHALIIAREPAERKVQFQQGPKLEAFTVVLP